MLRKLVLHSVFVVATYYCVWTAHAAEPATNSHHTIQGIVMEFRSGTADVPVCLCDAATGMPLRRDTYKPATSIEMGLAEWAVQVTDQKGQFHFENVPDGTYRLVAQKWLGPYKGLLELHGTIVQLMGYADDVVVPRPSDRQEAIVTLSPPGQGIIQFDQDQGNNETFLFLSTVPPECDPILGMHAMGASFQRHVIGINRMPYGKTTVIGVPDQPLYAFLFAADNSPGFASVKVPAAAGRLVRVPSEPFIAGWSNGRKTPPADLAELQRFLDEHSLSVGKLLDIPPLSNATFEAHQTRMRELLGKLSDTIGLPEGKSARIGDLLAVEAYQRLAAWRKK